MKILTRYVFKEFLIPLCYCMSGFVSIYVLFELFGSFSKLMGSQMPFTTGVEYFIAYLAPYFEWLAPAALMLAALYTMWNFCRHSELIAMRANGISFMTIVKPMLAVSIGMAVAVWWVNDCYVPEKAQWAKRLKSEKFDIKKIELADNIVYRNVEGHRTWTVGKVIGDDAEKLENVKVTIDRSESGPRLRVVTAKSASYLDGEWWFDGAEVKHFDASGNEIASPTPELDAVRFRPFHEFKEKPGDFVMQNRDWAYNSTRDRLRYLEKHTNLSEKTRRKYRYDVWAKILSPLSCIVITLFAIPAGIASGRQSVFKGILGALGMFFAFYGLTIGCMVVSDTGFVNPILAAVAPHAIFLALGARAFYKQR